MRHVKGEKMSNIKPMKDKLLAERIYEEEVSQSGIVIDLNLNMVNPHIVKMKVIEDRTKNNFEKENITFLENESTKISINGNEINLIGVGSPDGGHDYLDKAVKGIDLSDGYNVLLSHTYHIIDSIKNYDIDLVLAGDTHGGQIIYPLVGKLLLNKLFETKYLRGKYEIGNTILYVNRGLGTSLLPFRFNSYPEITRFKIKN